MILLFRQRIPRLDRILLVESSNRGLAERLLPQLYSHSPGIDLFTCYRGEPATFRSAQGSVYRSYDYRDDASRKKLYSELAGNRYGAIGVVCSGEPILLKWKWMLAYQVPAKLFIVNENADYFFVDYKHLHLVATLVRSRTGLTGANAAATLGRLLLFPFTLAYLLLYAAVAHARRKLRLMQKAS